MSLLPTSALPDAQDAVSSDEFKTSMRQLAGAVSVITIGRGFDKTGFTATSVSALSADQPSVLVSLNRGSSSWSFLERFNAFCVNVLSDRQVAIAQSFSGFGGRSGADRYRDADWEELRTGTPALTGAMTVLDCDLVETIHHRSHAILIGHVRATIVRQDVAPLLYWQGTFHNVGSPIPSPLA